MIYLALKGFDSRWLRTITMNRGRNHIVPERVGIEGLKRKSQLKAKSSLRARSSFAAALLALAAIAAIGSALAQTTESAQEKLELQFTDPLSTLPQLLIRDSYSPATYGTNVQTNQTILRPIIPRVPPYSLLPFDQLIRPTFSLVTVPSSHGGSRTEFGDTVVFDLGVLPWPDRKTSGWLVGVGPAFIFPTATSASAGQGAWQAGPALGAVYSGIPGLLVGFVLENPISFAYTSPPSTAAGHAYLSAGAGLSSLGSVVSAIG